MDVSRCTVYGKIRGAPRPRVTKRGAYMPKPYTDYKASIAAEYVAQGGENYGDSPVEIAITTRRALPKSRPKCVISELDTFKPDADNVAKTALDALNGVAFNDDSQVVSLTVIKQPRTRTDERIEIVIRPLEANMDFTLYEIDQAINDVIGRGFNVDEETGEVFFTADDLEELDAMRSEKLDGITCYIKSLEADAKALKDEEQALAARRKQKEKKAESLRNYVLSSMLKSGEKKLETIHGVYSTRKSTRCIIANESIVPDAYKTFETILKVDKKAITAAIKRGEEVPGADLATFESLQLK